MSPNPFNPPASETPTVDASMSVANNGFRLKLFGLLICTLPLIHYVYVWAFWLLASISRGEWARPGADDPKSFLYGIPLTLHIILLPLSFSAAPLAVAIGVWCGKFFRYLFAYSTCMVLSIILFRLDISQLTTWIAD